MTALTDDDLFLIAEARRIGPALRARTGDQERLAGEVIARLADLAERLAGELAARDHPRAVPDA